MIKFSEAFLMCHCEQSEANSTARGLLVGRASCPSFPNRQAGSLSHHSLLAMTIRGRVLRYVRNDTRPAKATGG
jgi:hypothetical protein